MRQSVRGSTVKLRHLNKSGVWPSGNPRWYFRPKGQKAKALPDLPHDSPAFLAAYAAAAGLAEPPTPQARSGSIGAAITAFLASDAFLSRAASTRGVWRRMLDDMRKRYGAGDLAGLAPRHIRADLAGRGPHPANNRLKVWRAACAWWVEAELVKTDPCEGVRKIKAPKTEGHPPWDAADLKKFRDCWALDTRERMAFELLHWTGARMSDAVRLSEGMIDRAGWLTYRQKKTGGEVSIPIRAPAPEVADPDGQAQLLAALDARPERHMLLMTTAFGKGRSDKAASAWFSAAARKAGIPGTKSAHGLRKTRLITLAEREATTHQMAAWCGHESLSEVAHYSKMANRRKILSGPDREHKSSNSAAEVPTAKNK